MPVATLDHVIIAISDLDEGIRQLTELTGVAPERGGMHTGGGTHNALLSLGEVTYLEVIAPVDRGAPDAWGLADKRTLTPIGWVIGTDDLQATSRVLREAGVEVATPRPGARDQLTGGTLRWRSAPLGLPGRPAPFVIEWEDAAGHPARTSPKGCTLTSLRVESPAAERITTLARALDLPLTATHADQPGLAVTLQCPTGEVVLSS